MRVPRLRAAAVLRECPQTVLGEIGRIRRSQRGRRQIESAALAHERGVLNFLGTVGHFFIVGSVRNVAPGRDGFRRDLLILLPLLRRLRTPHINGLAAPIRVANSP